MKHLLITILLLNLLSIGNLCSINVNPPAGKIAIIADGNSPDPDDLGGTAVTLALLRAAGLEKRLVHYSHSCDLVRPDRISPEAKRSVI